MVVCVGEGGTSGSPAIDLRQEPRSKEGRRCTGARAMGTKREHADGAGMQRREHDTVGAEQERRRVGEACSEQDSEFARSV